MSSQTTERSGREAERPRRAPPTPGGAEMAADASTRMAADAWPGLAGFWSADGRSLSQLGLNDNLRATETLLQGWQEALQAQRQAADRLRDLMRQQQDAALAVTMALLGAALGESGAASGTNLSSMEQAAARCGSAWRRSLDAGLACCWSGLVPPAATAGNTAPPSPDRAA